MAVRHTAGPEPLVAGVGALADREQVDVPHPHPRDGPVAERAHPARQVGGAAEQHGDVLGGVRLEPGPAAVRSGRRLHAQMDRIWERQTTSEGCGGRERSGL